MRILPNGRRRERPADTDPAMPLLQLLRDMLSMTGTGLDRLAPLAICATVGPAHRA